MQKEFDYELTSSIEYANKGETAEASFIKLLSPTSKNMTECAFLKQAFFRALPKDKEVDESGKGQENEIDADSVMMIIAMSNDVDLGGVMIAAKKLFTSGVAMVDGETKLTVPLADQLSNEDLEKMTGTYLANFILASALRTLNKK